MPDIAILVFFGHISFSISSHKVCLSAPVLILNKTEGEKLFALSQEFPPPPEGEFVHFCDNTVWVRKVQREFVVKHSIGCFRYGIRQWRTFFQAGVLLYYFGNFVANLRNFLRTFYGPNNVVVCQI